MPLLYVVIVLLVVGLLLGLVNKYGPPEIDAKFIKLINIVVMIAVIIWLLKISGIWAYLAGVHV
jgi:hypothetical protein